MTVSRREAAVERTGKNARCHEKSARENEAQWQSAKHPLTQNLFE